MLSIELKIGVILKEMFLLVNMKLPTNPIYKKNTHPLSFSPLAISNMLKNPIVTGGVRQHPLLQKKTAGYKTFDTKSKKLYNHESVTSK